MSALVFVLRRWYYRQKGKTMQLNFKDGTSLQVQKVVESGGRLQVLVAGTQPEQLRTLFTDPLKTGYMKVTERGETLAEYAEYTEFYRTEEYTGKIYGVVVNQVGKSVEERLAETEEKTDELIENAKNNGRQITDLQLAVCELYEGTGV